VLLQMHVHRILQVQSQQLRPTGAAVFCAAHFATISHPLEITSNIISSHIGPKSSRRVLLEELTDVTTATLISLTTLATLARGCTVHSTTAAEVSQIVLNIPHVFVVTGVMITFTAPAFRFSVGTLILTRILTLVLTRILTCSTPPQSK
jgi:hypothetical protein